MRRHFLFILFFILTFPVLISAQEQPQTQPQPIIPTPQPNYLAPSPLPGGTIPIPLINLDVRQPRNGQEIAFSVQMLLLLAILTLAPSFAVLMTSFLRVSIVLDFVKRAIGLQQAPPTQVLNGLALFLTLFIMWPTLSDVYEKSLRPMAEGQITTQQMVSEAESPIRIFMYKQMQQSPENIRLFMRMRGLPAPQSLADVPTYVLIPAFILHELSVAFKIGVYIYIPFLIIDMVVSSILMAMGMIMLPPVMVSMPFKLILFWLVDGWTLIVQQLVAGFR
ncbi:MAG: flagellar type III secretion system pore protein FliP [Spirochaetia bacterium]